MKITVMGAGAMGSVYGAYLSRVPGNQVYMLDVWREHVEAINANGLKIKDGAEDVIFPVKAACTAGEIGVSDLVIVFVKSISTAQAMADNRDLFGEKTIVMSLQNGYGNADDIAEFVPRDNIIIGTTSHGANVLGPGYIKHAGTGITAIGGLTGAGAVFAQNLAPIFTQAGFNVQVMDNVMEIVWHKLFYSVGCNALTALLNVTNGTLLNSESSLSLMKELVYEAVEVANASGMRFDKDKELEHVRQVSKLTGENRSSMLQDVSNKRRTEIDKMNGIITKMGQDLGIETPANKTITALTRALEAFY